MNKVYVVMGGTGEYSDHREWAVKAFLDPDRAADLVVKASARARELVADGWRSWDDDFKDVRNEHDPRMDVDYNGVRYEVMEVELDAETARP